MRCDLGSVDDPHDPPCVRCRRESKECFFSATRRKRNHADVGQDGAEADVGNDYEIRNSRKRLCGEEHMSDDLNGTASSQTGTNHVERLAGQSSVSSTTSTIIQRPLTPRGSIRQLQPLRRPTLGVNPSMSPQTSFDGDHFHQQQYSPGLAAPTIGQADAVEEEQQITAEKILQTGIYSGHDALNLLFEAAGRSGDITNARDENQVNPQPPPIGSGMVTTQPQDGNILGNRQIETMAQPYLHNLKREETVANMPIDPAIRNGDTFPKPPADDEMQARDYQNARSAWSSCRFVRAGWFTAQEAIAYIE